MKKNRKKTAILILLGIGITWGGVMSALIGIGGSTIGGLISLGVSVLFAILFIAVLYDKANFSWKSMTGYDM